MKFSFFPAVVLSFTFGTIGFAGSATWNLNPTSGDWNTPTNWTPNTIPNSSSDIATFAGSSITELAFSSGIVVGGMIFNSGASSYSFTTGDGPAFQIAGPVTN